MTDSIYTRSTPLVVLVYLSILLLTSGCDTLDLDPGQSIILTTSTGEICFRFTGVSADGSKSILSVDSFDLGAFLEQEGFSKAEVISATVSSADMRLVFPLGESLDMLERATVSLRASGAGEVAVASASSFSDTRSTSLQVQSSNIGGIVRASSFQGVLEFDGAQTVSDDIEISVELDIRIEVEGV